MILSKLRQDAAVTPARVRREDMTTQGRSSAEVAVGLSKAEWRRTVDAARSDGVTAVRARHIRVDTEEMAVLLQAQLREGASFEELATMASACDFTREKGGEIGWVGVNDEHLDEYFPKSLRERAIEMKPGDVLRAASELGEHLVQVVDVFQTLNIESNPRTRGLPGKGLKPQPLIQLLRASRDDDRSLKQFAAGAVEGGEGGEGGVGEGEGVLMRNSGKARVAMKYSMESMGCQMNTADAERMEGQLRALGFQKTEKPAEAQVVVLNTCSIREHAEAKVYSYLGPHANRKRDGEDMAIIVAGCVAQQEGEALLRRVPEIDMVMGPQYANRIGDLLEGARAAHPATT